MFNSWQLAIWQHHRTKRGIFQHAMFDYQRILVKKRGIYRWINSLTLFSRGFTSELPVNFWLVVMNIWIIFPYIGNVIILTDFHIFQRGRSTTNQIFYLFDKVFSPLNGAFPLGPTWSRPRSPRPTRGLADWAPEWRDNWNPTSRYLGVPSGNLAIENGHL